MAITQFVTRETQQHPKAPLHQEPIPKMPPVTNRPRLYRIWHILGDKKSKPPIEPIAPISRAHFYALIAAQILPGPRKHGRNSFWTEEDVQKILEVLGGGKSE